MRTQQGGKSCSLPLSQIAISSIDLQRSEQWWREGLGFLPSAHTRMFRGKTMSGVVRLDNAATTTRWLVGQDHWLQIELWQYENPLPRLTLNEGEPNRAGFRRCGVWVKAFDETLQCLAALGSKPIGTALGEPGQRRVCVRDPDGILVEIFERDPLEGQVAPAAYTCNAALRSITLVSEDRAASVDFVERGLGMQTYAGTLHDDTDEALWGLAGAQCKRAVFKSDAILLEVVEYQSPSTLPRHPHARLNDQGILNIAFGDRQSSAGVEMLALQSMQAGAIPSDRMHTPLGGCVYMTDPQSFSFELMWSRTRLGHRITGYLPKRSSRYTLAANQQIKLSLRVEEDVAGVFKRFADPYSAHYWPETQSMALLDAPTESSTPVGLTRMLSTRFFNHREQITEWRAGQEMRYRLLDHPLFAICTGHIYCEPEADATRVYWTLRFRARLPGLGWALKLWLRNALAKQLHRALKSEDC